MSKRIQKGTQVLKMEEWEIMLEEARAEETKTFGKSFPVVLIPKEYKPRD